MNKKKVCVLKETKADLLKYGFVYENCEWVYYQCNTKRIYIPYGNAIEPYKLFFNQVTTEVLYVLSRMIKDNVVDFIDYTRIKKHCIILNDEEYELILEKRKQKKG